MSDMNAMRWPRLSIWQRRLLWSLVGLYVVELLARNAGLPIASLAWFPFGEGFRIWQPVTHYLVQSAGVQWVLIGLVVIYFFISGLSQLYTERQLLHAIGMAALGGVLTAFSADVVLPLATTPASGWGVLTVSLVVLLGLAVPRQPVYLFFILPIEAKWLTWAALGLPAFGFLLAPSLGAAEAVGAWGGTWLWYTRLGPGSRRRALVAEKAQVESELERLRRFRVIEGGRDASPQRDQDENVH